MFCSARARPANADRAVRKRCCASGSWRAASSVRSNLGFGSDGYALAWFLVNDRVKLLAYRIFDPAKFRTASDLRRRSPNGLLNYTSSKVAEKVTLLRLGSMHGVKSEKGDPKIDRRDPGGWRS
jgi:hypothetical protein